MRRHYCIINLLKRLCGQEEGLRLDQERQVYELQARLCHVLANPKRLEILYTLRSGEMTAGDLARTVSVTTANLSQHLALMKQQGLLDARKDGLNMYYRLATPEILDACRSIRKVLTESIMRRSGILQGVEV